MLDLALMMEIYGVNFNIHRGPHRCECGHYNGILGCLDVCTYLVRFR